MRRVIIRYAMDVLVTGLLGGLIGDAYGFWPGLTSILLILNYSLWCYMDGLTSARIQRQAAAPPPPEQDKSVQSLGIPACGGPLCGESDHHPLCSEATEPPLTKQAELVQMTAQELDDLLPTNDSMSRQDSQRWVARATERHHKIGVTP